MLVLVYDFTYVLSFSFFKLCDIFFIFVTPLGRRSRWYSRKKFSVFYLKQRNWNFFFFCFYFIVENSDTRPLYFIENGKIFLDWFRHYLSSIFHRKSGVPFKCWTTGEGKYCKFMESFVGVYKIFDQKVGKKVSIRFKPRIFSLLYHHCRRSVVSIQQLYSFWCGDRLKTLYFCHSFRWCYYYSRL